MNSINKIYKYLFILFILNLYVYNISCAPTLTGVIPSFGSYYASPVTFTGTNFISLKPTFFVDGVATESYNSSPNKFINIIGPGPNGPNGIRTQYEIYCEDPVGDKSNTVTFGLYEWKGFSQVNQDIYFKGAYSGIPNKSQIRVSPSQTNDFSTVTYINATSMSFKATYALAAQAFGSIGFYDGSTSKYVSVIQHKYAPIVSSASFTLDRFSINGFVYLSTTTIVIGSSTCVINSQTDTNIVCTPDESSVLDSNLQYTVKHSNDASTVLYYSFTPLKTFTNLANGVTCNLGVSNLVTLNTLVYGLSPTAITPTSQSTTVVSFEYPLNAKCGYAFLGASTNRVTNNKLICPTPKITSIITIPDGSNSLLVSFKGNYLSQNYYGSLTGNALTYSFINGDGSTFVCTNLNTVWNSLDSSYTVSCNVNQKYSFKIQATTVTGQSTSAVVGYTPTVTSATPTDYLVPSQVTITGTQFANFNLLVQIGGKTCTNPTVNLGGTQIVCDFSADVVVSNFKTPLAVSVSVDSTYIASNAVFLYNRPQPVISSASSTTYDTPGTVTIVGQYFFTTDPITVTIGGVACTNPSVNPQGTQITCTFSSTAAPGDYITPLAVKVTIESVYTGTKSVFTYTRPNPVIISSSSLGYQLAGIVSIIGKYYTPATDLVVTIGGKTCTSPSATESKITCLFSADVPVADFNDPLTISVSINSAYTSTADKFYYNRLNPIVSSASSLVYNQAGIVTIKGTYFAIDDLIVTIGDGECALPNVVSMSEITCTFQANIPTDDYFIDPLLVAVSVRSTSGSNSVFYYTRPQPILTSSSSLFFNQAGTITINGNYFAYTGTNVIVQVGGSACTSVAIVSTNEITCNYQANVAVSDYNTPLEVSVSIDSQYNAQSSIFYYKKPNPSIISASSTTYKTAGKVTILGTQFVQDNLFVTIGQVECTTPLVSGGGTNIICDFPSNAPTASDFKSPLEVFVSIKSTYTTKNSVFYYTRPNPVIISSTSTLYGTPSTITITGSYFNSKDILVKVGGSQCTDPISSQDGTSITCLFQSNVVVKDSATPLLVSVVIEAVHSDSKAVFYYVRSNPTILSCTSTKYGVPGKVTVIGTSFSSHDFFVQIGGSNCLNPTYINQQTVTCNFNSDVSVSNYLVPLQVFMSIANRFNASNDVFLYVDPDKKCPIGSNNLECSGHGTCNQQFTCDCQQGWESSDCSIPNKGGVIPDPNINPNDTSSTIITPSGAIFDIGIVLINELDNSNNLIHSYNVSSISWNNITKQDNLYSYTTNLPNTKSTLNVLLTVNPLNERVYYNFAGDVIPILPKSIKYQVELQNYTFSSSLNTMEFVFQSGIIDKGDECVYDESTKTQTTTDDSIRSIQMTLNGETLIGTFSDRIVLDNRPSYNKVNQLTDDQITKYQLNSQSLYVSIATTYFKTSVVVDPNFGVLVSSSPDPNACKKGFASWKIAVIVVCSVVGVALVTATVLLIKKKRIVSEFNKKLKVLSKNNPQ